jgi:hypothetical protein
MYKLIIIVSIFILGLYFVYSYPSPMEGFELGIGRSRCPNILIQKGAVFYLYNSKLAKIPGVNPLQFNSLDDYVEFMDWQRSQGIRCPILYLQESYDAQGNPVLNARPSPTDLQGGLQPVIGDVGTISGTKLVGQEPTNVGPNEIVSANKNMRIASRQEYKDAFGVQPLPSYELVPETKLIDAGRDDKPYNTNSYPSYDPLGLYNGLETPLDKMESGPDGNGILSVFATDHNWGGIKYTQEMIDSGKVSSTRVNDPYE